MEFEPTNFDPMGVFVKVYHAIIGKSNGMDWYKESIFKDYGISLLIGLWYKEYVWIVKTTIWGFGFCPSHLSLGSLKYFWHLNGEQDDRPLDLIGDSNDGNFCNTQVWYPRILEIP